MGIYTDKAESALKKAQRFSARMHHPYTGTEHILMGLLDEPDSTAGQVLAGAGVTPKGLAEMIDQLIAPEGMVLTEQGICLIYRMHIDTNLICQLTYTGKRIPFLQL